MPEIQVPRETTALRVRQEGTRVLLLDGQTGAVLADMPWEKAEELGKALMRQAARAEAVHWAVCGRHFTDGIRVRRVLGMPVVTSEQQMEALGGGLRPLTKHLKR